MKTLKRLDESHWGSVPHHQNEVVLMLPASIYHALHTRKARTTERCSYSVEDHESLRACLASVYSNCHCPYMVDENSVHFSSTDNMKNG